MNENPNLPYSAAANTEHSEAITNNLNILFVFLIYEKIGKFENHNKNFEFGNEKSLLWRKWAPPESDVE